MKGTRRVSEGCRRWDCDASAGMLASAFDGQQQPGTTSKHGSFAMSHTSPQRNVSRSVIGNSRVGHGPSACNGQPTVSIRRSWRLATWPAGSLRPG